MLGEHYDVTGIRVTKMPTFLRSENIERSWASGQHGQGGRRSGSPSSLCSSSFQDFGPSLASMSSSLEAVLHSWGPEQAVISFLSSDLPGLPAMPTVPSALLQPCCPVAHTAGKCVLGAGSHSCQSPEPRTYLTKNMIYPERIWKSQ